MKKFFSVIIAVMMMLTAMSCVHAQTADELIDMNADTMLFMTDELTLEMELAYYEADGSAIYAYYADEDTDYIVGIAFYDYMTLDILTAEEQAEEEFIIMMYDETENVYAGTCSKEAYASGSGMDVYPTAANENGWYQAMFIGNICCEENGETVTVIGAFDLHTDGNAEVTHDQPAPDNTCSSCGGTGMCGHCDLGYCSYCDFGQKECYCLFGDCSACDGMGYSSYYDYEYGIEYRDCTACGGLGMHDYCNGTGFLDCSICAGSGYCNYCYGTGECSLCYGTGVR